MASFCLPSAAAAQSLTSAALVGSVRDTLGRPLFDVSVTAVNRSSGLTRQVVTTRTGHFAFALLPPARYDVLAEAVGYRPKRVLSVPVLPGNPLDLSIELQIAPPPVNRVDTVAYPGGMLMGQGSGMGRRFAIEGGGDFAESNQDVSDQLRHASNATELATEGLPSSERTTIVEGLPFVPARHPALGLQQLQTFAFPALAADGVELLTDASDVEFRGSQGGFMVIDPRSGTDRLRGEATGDWSGKVASSSRFFQPQSDPHNTWRGGAVLTGPILRDTASFVLGVAARRAQTPFSPQAMSDTALAGLVATARDSFHQDLAGYAAPRVSQETIVSGFGRVDWQLSASQLLTTVGNFGTASLSSPVLDLARFANPGSRVTGTDFNATSTLTSVLTPRAAHELRVGVSTSKREYDSGPLPATLVLEPALAMGTDPAFPGRFQRTEVQVRDVLHIGFGAHLVKVGAEGDVASMDDSYAEGRGGLFTFGDASHLARLNGTFAQTAGPPPTARFALPRFAGMVQDLWSVAPGIRFTVGMRFDYQRVPRNDVVRNDSLFAMTGLDNADLPASLARVSPRLGFVWAPGGQGALVLQGSAALYSQTIDPALMSEVITNSGRVELHSVTGTLPSWPAAPDPNPASVPGRDITLYGPSTETPRTGRLMLGLSRAMGTSAAFQLTGTYSHTDFLPRRQDLNLPISPAGADVHGRAVYGVLQQLGQQLVPVPGSNRRFPAFDHIWALDPDGYSDYWGITVGLERESRGGVRLAASYTYSKSTDNWLSRPGLVTASQMNPFPAGVSDQDWAVGTSDLDVPHHVTIGLALPVVNRNVRLGILYSYRSGYPFTPGFRDGVDLNGDGSAVNDAAYVDDAIAGTSDLFGAWSCLAGQDGRVAARNSCRSPGVHRLDARLRLTTGRPLRIQCQLVVDALNLLDSSEALPDGALYLVDASRATTVNPATGVVSIPLVTNPNFGQPLVRLASGRSFRIGLRLSQ